MARVAVVGAGAVGVYHAACVEQAEEVHDVEVVARRPPAGPLALEDADGAVHDLRATVRLDVADLAPVDWVLLATKAHHVPGAAAALARLCRGGTRVVVLQNGVGHEARLAPHVPPGTVVVPGIVTTGIEPSGVPGRTRFTAGGILNVADDEHGRALAALFAGAPIRISLEADFATAQWWKLALNASSSAVQAVTGLPAGVTGGDAGADLVRLLVAEVAEVARAAGADLDQATVDGLVRLCGRMGPDDRGSQLVDRQAGRPLEFEAITGAVVDEGTRLGVPTPHHTTMRALLRAIDATVRAD